MTYTFETEHSESLPCVTEGQNLIKASLFNLLAISDSLEEAARCHEFVHLVTQKFPALVFRIKTDETSQMDFFHTEHTVQSVGHGTNKVCFDEIIIESSRSELKKAPFVLLPKILPDLPVYLFFAHNPIQDQVLFPELQKYATRIIFDCQQIDDIPAFSKEMRSYHERKGLDFVDSNWAKTKAWREVFSRVFDDVKKISLLQDAKRIQISYCRPSHEAKSKVELQALYLQAWLAAQLGWKLKAIKKEDGRLHFTYSSQDKQLDVSLIATDTQMLAPSEIYSVEVMTYSECHCLISHEKEANQVVVHASNPERCEMPFTLFLSSYQKGGAFVNEVLYQPISEHYQNVLKELSSDLYKELST